MFSGTLQILRTEKLRPENEKDEIDGDRDRRRKNERQTRARE